MAGSPALGADAIRKPASAATSLARRLVIPCVGLAALVVFAALYRFQPALYDTAMRAVGVSPSYPPFLDLHQVLALIDCSERGIDVYVTDPCDPLNRPLGYSPLWLRATFLPGPFSLIGLGLGLGAVFLLSLAAIPAPKTRRNTFVMIAAILSPPALFAVERGNVDEAIFVAAVAVALLSMGNGMARGFGYFIAVTAAALKFYPITLLVLVLRERRAWAVGILAVIGIAGLVTLFFTWDTLLKIVPNLPHTPPFTNGFGAIDLPQGVAQFLHGAGANASTARVAEIALYAMMLGRTAWAVVRDRASMRAALADLFQPERALLIAGAALIAGCFFAGPNVGYRAIFLLLTLPAALSLRAPFSRLYKLVVVILWSGALTWGGSFLRFLTDSFGDNVERRVYALLWLATQLLWWELGALLLTVLWCFAAERWRQPY